MEPVQAINSLATPAIPSGMPATDPNKPKWALTQDQIDFLLDQAGKFWPSFKLYWPIIVLIASALGIGGGFAGRVTAPVEKETTVIEKVIPTDPPKVDPAKVHRRIIYAVTKDADLDLLKNRPAGIVEYYPVGTGYNFQGQVLPLPVMVVIEDGVYTEVKKLP